MPKRFYNIGVKAELQKNRIIATGRGPRGDHKTLVLTGRAKHKQRPTSFPIFEFLDKALKEKPVGATAIYIQKRQNGGKVKCVYMKGENGYFLIERHHKPLAEKKSRFEAVAVHPNWKPEKPFADEYVKRMIGAGKFRKQISLHGSELTRKQGIMLKKAGWTFVKAVKPGTWPGYWKSPEK